MGAKLGRGHRAYSGEVGKASQRSDSGASWKGKQELARERQRGGAAGSFPAEVRSLARRSHVCGGREGSSPVWAHFRPLVSPCLSEHPLLSCSMSAGLEGIKEKPDENLRIGQVLFYLLSLTS